MPRRTPPALYRLPGIDPTQPYSIDGNGVVQNATFNALGAETATLFQENISQANNFQWLTKFDDGGPLRGIFDASFAHATSNLQAAQADVEHGYTPPASRHGHLAGGTRLQQRPSFCGPTGPRQSWL